MSTTTAVLEPRPRGGLGPISLGDRARARIGHGALGGLLLAALVLAVGAASSPSTEVPVSYLAFPGWIAGPLPDIDLQMTSPRFITCVVVMALCHGAVLATWRSLATRWVLGAIAAAHLIFVLAPPILSPDVFGYLAYARLGALYGLNPYVYLPEIPTDDVYNYIRWRDQMNPYGPLFTLITYPFAFVGLAGGLWGMKVLIGLSSLAIVALTWSCARRLGTAPLGATAFVGLNPFLLAYAVGGAHNDLAMLALVMVGVRLGLEGREAAGGGVLAAAAGVKALSAGLLLPFLVAGASRRGAALVGTLSGLCAVGGVSLLFFGNGVFGLIDAWQMQSDKVSSHNFPNGIGWFLGLGGVTPGVRVVAASVLVVSIASLLWLTWTRRMDWLTAMAFATLALLVTTTWLMHWYLAWLMPLAALGRSAFLRWAVLLLPLVMVVLGLPPVPK